MESNDGGIDEPVNTSPDSNGEPKGAVPSAQRKSFLRRHPKASIASAIVIGLFIVAGVTAPPPNKTVTIKDASAQSQRWSGTDPNLTLSPGSTSAKANADSICKPGYAASVKAPSSKAKTAAFKSYGISNKHDIDQYDLANVIPVALGGDNSASNLWPLSKNNAAPGATRTDASTHVRELVCAHQIDLATAQRAFQGNLQNVVQQFGSVAVTTTTTTTSTTLAPTTTTTSTTAASTTSTTSATASTSSSAKSGTSSSSGGDGYTNVDGNHVQSPVQAPSAPAGATARCGDGSYSFSQNHSGTCSHHGGVAAWL